MTRWAKRYTQIYLANSFIKRLTIYGCCDLVIFARTAHTFNFSLLSPMDLVLRINPSAGNLIRLQRKRLQPSRFPLQNSNSFIHQYCWLVLSWPIWCEDEIVNYWCKPHFKCACTVCVCVMYLLLVFTVWMPSHQRDSFTPCSSFVWDMLI